MYACASELADGTACNSAQVAAGCHHILTCPSHESFASAPCFSCKQTAVPTCTWKSSLMRSSGAVAVRAMAPAAPPARNILWPCLACEASLCTTTIPLDSHAGLFAVARQNAVCIGCAPCDRAWGRRRRTTPSAPPAVVLHGRSTLLRRWDRPRQMSRRLLGSLVSLHLARRAAAASQRGSAPGRRSQICRWWQLLLDDLLCLTAR